MSDTISEETVRRWLTMGVCVRLMREAFLALAEGRAQNQPRRRLVLPSGAVLHQMAASCGRYFGTKIYSTHASHGAHFTFLLYAADTGQPLAQLEANALGQIRTGAASGLATDLLARPEAHRLGIVGSGFQAWTQLAAMLAVRPIRDVRVYSRSRERCRAFAEQARQAFQVDARPADSAGEACRDADIVVTATYSKDPVLDADWIAPGTHVNAMGSNQAARRELPASLLDRARLIVVDSRDQALLEAGDLLLARPPGQWSRWPLVEMADLVAGRSAAPAADEGVTVFKSLGLAVEDVVAAGYVYERWLEERESR